jgi:hypothetical protein
MHSLFTRIWYDIPNLIAPGRRVKPADTPGRTPLTAAATSAFLSGFLLPVASFRLPLRRIFHVPQAFPARQPPEICLQASPQPPDRHPFTV